MNANAERRLAAIVLADVVGYARLMGADEDATLAALRALRRELLEPEIAAHRGRLVKTMGDGFLVEFGAAVDAVTCAVAVQRSMAERNAAVAPDRALRLRIGIHVGDVLAEDGDIFGDGVNLAARIEALAEPDGIALSDDAYRQVRDRTDVAWQDGGAHEVKNIARPVSVWRWRAGEPGLPAAAPSVTPQAARAAASVAVLPFDNMSGDPEQAYFADGITDDIITGLSQVRDLLVISRNSAFAYRGRAAKVVEVCRDLNVRYVVEGSVRKAGARVRINAQLTDGQTGGTLWADRYDRELADIFAVQDDVTEKIVRSLEIKLVGALAAPEHTANPQAYDYVLRGRAQYRLFTPAGNAAARALFEQAIALDPDYAEPYAGLAETYVQDLLMGAAPALDRAYELAQQAAARDPSLPLVHEALSTAQLFKKQHAEAVATARRWVDIEPSNADAYTTLAGALHFAGDNDEVIALVQTAMRINPFYPFFYPHYIGLARLAMGRFAEAAEAFERAIVINPDVPWPHLFLAAGLAHLGDLDRARDQVAEARRIHPDITVGWLQTYMPYKRHSDLETLIGGLHAAGLSV